MTTYTWPTGRAFMPSSMQLLQRHPTQRVAESPLSGDIQTSSLPGSRWGWEMVLPDTLKTAESAAIEGFLAGLNGREHRVQLYDFKRPTPRGNINPAGITLGANASQFGQTVQLAGCLSASNLLLGPGFEFDSNADGIADHWAAYQTGNTGVVTRTHDNTTAVGAGYSQTIHCASMAGATTDRAGIVQINALAGQAGTTITAGADAWGDAGQEFRVFVQLWLGGAAGQVICDSTATLSNAWQRYSATGTATQAFDAVYVYFWHQARPGGGFGAATLHIDQAALQYGVAEQYPGPATLLAGDWLNLAGQLLMVPQDTAADDSGSMTLPVRHMLRAAAPAGSAVTLYRPTAQYILDTTDLTLSQRIAGNRQPGLRLRLLEVW